MWWKKQCTCQWGESCLMGALTDFHETDAQYTKSAIYYFMPEQNVQSASSTTKNKDYSIENLIELMKSTPDYSWTSVELHERYSHLCETSDILSEKQLITNLQYSLGERQVWHFWVCQSTLLLRPPAWLPLTGESGWQCGLLSKITKIVSECQSFTMSQSMYELG